MATVIEGADGCMVVAVTATELALLDHATRQGRLVLLDAYYTLHGRSVLLPAGMAAAQADHVRRALEAAAEAHDQAVRRRRDFRLVEE